MIHGTAMRILGYVMTRVAADLKHFEKRGRFTSSMLSVRPVGL